jgi:large subunit ribosomal protein L10
VNRNDKAAVIERLREALADVPAVIVTDFVGLTVEETDTLRSKFREAGVKYEVVKNTLVKRAIADTPMTEIAPLFKGNSAIAYHAEDPVAPAKIIRDFAKDNEKLRIKGGWLDGKALDAAGVEQLAALPGKDELRAKLLSVLNGVPTKFVRTLIAAPQSFIGVLNARKQQLEEAA